MSKRKLEEDSIEYGFKKSKLELNLDKEYHHLIELLSKQDQCEDENQVLDALKYFRSIFPQSLFENLPQIIHMHQIYSLIQNKTNVDRQIYSLRANNEILMFKFDSNQESEILLCFIEDFKQYIKEHIQKNSSQKYIIDVFMNKILPNEKSQLNITKTSLLNEYKLGDSDISSLVQLGFLAIKDPSSFWFSIPNLGKFRRILIETRKSVLDILKRQKYKELNLKSFFNNLLIKKNKNFKTINKIGVIYIVCDLIGLDLVKKIISPIGLSIKLN